MVCPVVIFGFQNHQGNRVHLDLDRTAIGHAPMDFIAAVIGPDAANLDAQFTGFRFDRLTWPPVPHRAVTMIVGTGGGRGNRTGAENHEYQYGAHRSSFPSGGATFLPYETDSGLKPVMIGIQLPVSL